MAPHVQARTAPSKRTNGSTLQRGDHCPPGGTRMSVAQSMAHGILNLIVAGLAKGSDPNLQSYLDGQLEQITAAAQTKDDA